MDLSAIAAAIALRFDPSTVTPPSGYDDIKLSTHRLPNAITETPTVLVMATSGDFSYASMMRTGNLGFRVAFYYAPKEDLPRVMDALYAWFPVLVERLVGQVQLGQSANGVTHAVIGGYNVGWIRHADIEYAGIEFGVVVHLSEGVNFVA